MSEYVLEDGNVLQGEWFRIDVINGVFRVRFIARRCDIWLSENEVEDMCYAFTTGDYKITRILDEEKSTTRA